MCRDQNGEPIDEEEPVDSHRLWADAADPTWRGVPLNMDGRHPCPARLPEEFAKIPGFCVDMTQGG